jgi:MOSC domain-containing protein YiiM
MTQTHPDAVDVEHAENVAFHRSLVEIQAAYEDGASPLLEGVVELVVRPPAERRREVVEVAELTESDGLVGDNWATRPVKSTPDGAPDPRRQLTIMSARALSAVAGTPERWPLAGDQLIVDLDLSFDRLPAGSRLQIGAAQVEVSEPPHTGCAKFAGRFGLDALRFVSSREGKRRRLRGLNARVVRSGLVRRGDRIGRL